ncbi:MAG: hypothetical protein HQL41_09375 [Alphaproteobacteria bacterium]|nr:hypothetical protein [Alphaproteobacteria bacterium]
METEESASGHETIEATGPGVTLTWQEILDCDGSECEDGPAPDEILVAAQAAVDGGLGDEVPTREALIALGWDELTPPATADDAEDAEDHSTHEPPAWGRPDDDFHPGSRGRGNGAPDEDFVPGGRGRGNRSNADGATDANPGSNNGRGWGTRRGDADGEERAYAAFRLGMGGLSSGAADPLAGCCGEEGGLAEAGGAVVCDEETRLMRMGKGKGHTAADYFAG